MSRGAPKNERSNTPKTRRGSASDWKKRKLTRPHFKRTGGDLGFTPESSLRNTDPSTRDIVMKLKPGQYSSVIGVVNPASKQLMGFRIVKLLAKEPAGQRELADPRVQQAVRSQLRDRREQLLKAAYYEILRHSAKVEHYYAKNVLDSNGMVK